jgi:hypothetical protein
MVKDHSMCLKLIYSSNSLLSGHTQRIGDSIGQRMARVKEAEANSIKTVWDFAKYMGVLHLVNQCS